MLFLFDFGGVLAEEGFQQGLYAIAHQYGMEPESFFQTAAEQVYSCGYVTGQATENIFWQVVRDKTGITATDEELTAAILSRFIPRQAMLELVVRLHQQQHHVVILSDQSDWLDRLNEYHQFFHLFDEVFNSYHLGKSKKDPTIFTDVLHNLSYAPENSLFVDDNQGHIERAVSQGLHTHLFTTLQSLKDDLTENYSVPLCQ